MGLVVIILFYNLSSNLQSYYLEIKIDILQINLI